MKSLIGHVLFNGIKRYIRKISEPAVDIDKMMGDLEVNMADIVAEATAGFQVAFTKATEEEIANFRKKVELDDEKLDTEIEEIDREIAGLDRKLNDLEAFEAVLEDVMEGAQAKANKVWNK